MSGGQPNIFTSSAAFTLPSAPRFDIMNPSVVDQYKQATNKKKGQFVVSADVLKNGIIISPRVKIEEAYIYTEADFGRNQFHLYYLNQNEKANIRSASKLLSNYVRTNPRPLVTQWGSCFFISADVSVYDAITGLKGPKKILFKYSHYNRPADDSDSDSDSSSGDRSP